MSNELSLGVSSGTEVNLNPVKWPLNLHVNNRRLMPKDDMTPREAVLLMMLLTCAIGGGAYIDYEAFISEHALDRHFQAL